ncbi:hypothetical protein KCU63_g22350, partial [Aureobasidium melanogenum]
VGSTGHALLLERIASCYSSRRGHGKLNSGSRHRKAAFYHVLAAEAWLKLDKPRQSEQNLTCATEIYATSLPPSNHEISSFEHLETFLLQLKQAVVESRPATRDDAGATATSEQQDQEDTLADVETIQEQPSSGQRSHARSLSTAAAAAPSTAVSGLDPLGVAVLPPPHSPTLEERPDPANDGFE